MFGQLLVGIETYILARASIFVRTCVLAEHILVRLHGSSEPKLLSIAKRTKIHALGQICFVELAKRKYLSQQMGRDRPCYSY